MMTAATYEKFNEVKSNGLVIGTSLIASDHQVFFGNKFGTIELLQKVFPEFEFLVLKQVHGNNLVRAPAIESADGHWTSEKKQALCIYTADCLPVMIASKENVTAIHAGWRGLVCEVILGAEASDSSIAYIGPHIAQENFEVHLDVAQELIRVGPPKILMKHPDPSKVFVDLDAIGRYQLRRIGVPQNRIFTSAENTFGNPNYYSYRGDRANCGRLISFIVKT